MCVYTCVYVYIYIIISLDDEDYKVRGQGAIFLMITVSFQLSF